MNASTATDYTPGLYLLRSRDGSTLEHPLWWRPNRSGYTSHILEAGTYTEDEARSLERGAPEKVHPVPIDQALNLWLDGGRSLNPEVAGRAVLGLIRRELVPPSTMLVLRRLTDPIVRAAQAKMKPGQTFHEKAEILVERAMRKGLRDAVEAQTSCVLFVAGELFDLGSTSSEALCRALGWNPHHRPAEALEARPEHRCAGRPILAPEHD